MAALLDKNLSDDMLKLVRYKVLFVRREFEVAFSEREDLIADNLSENSFVAWKIAEFIQELEAGKTPIPSKWRAKQYPAGFTLADFLTGIPHDDKKYLRVHYEVLERYPRQKFKYEEQQITVLEQIRDALGPVTHKSQLAGSAAGPVAGPAAGPGAGAVTGPYGEILDQLQANGQTFNTWRENFHRCAPGVAQALSRIFERYKDLGGFPTPSISAQEIKNALTKSPSGADRILDRMAGAGEVVLQVFVRKKGMPPSDNQAPPYHSVRSSVMRPAQPGISYLQKVAESYSQQIGSEDAAAIQKALDNNQVDLHVHAYSDSLGLVSWSSLNQQGAIRMRAIAYPLAGKILYFKQMLNRDLTPLSGSMPQAEFIQVVPDQFIVALDFEVEEAGKKSVCTCAMPINFDFAKCSTAFLGLILKFKRTG
jgi:hypothetical protein